MPKALKYVTFLDLIFLLFISLSGFVEGVVGSIVYYLAFLVPVALAFVLKRVTGVSFSAPSMKISPQDLGLTLPLAAPLIAVIFLISWLTSLVLSAVGDGNISDVSGNIFNVIFTHAVLTAVLEETLFRYLPIAFIAPHSKKYAVLFSALFFAFAHCNLYQLPYAFVAGVVFSVIDIATDSIIPSLLLHFLNNLISIFWLRGMGNGGFTTICVIALSALAILSFLPIFILRSRYLKKISLIAGEEEKIRLSYEPMIFFATTLLVAVISL